MRKLIVFFFVFLMTVSAGSAMAASKIVFSHGSTSQIFVMNSDGSGLTNISNNAFDDRLPSWSPDGSQIAFTSSRPSVLAPVDIYVMNADGSNQTKLIDVALENIDAVSWSPELPANVASISPFGQFVIVFMLGGASALWMSRRQQASSLVASP